MKTALIVLGVVLLLLLIYLLAVVAIRMIDRTMPPDESMDDDGVPARSIDEIEADTSDDSEATRRPR